MVVRKVVVGGSGSGSDSNSYSGSSSSGSGSSVTYINVWHFKDGPSSFNIMAITAREEEQWASTTNLFIE